MLVAEDLLLLLTDDATGRLLAGGSEVDVALGGALLVELAMLGRADVTGPAPGVRAGRLVVVDAGPTGDQVLDEALARVAAKAGKKPESVVGGLGKGVRPRLTARLAERGLLREEQGKVLGLFPVTRWPAANAAHEGVVRDRLATALLTGRAPDERTAALVALLHALGATAKVVRPESLGTTKRELRANAKRVAEGDWASTAVRKAVEASQAATVAVIAAGAAVAGSGS